MKDSVRRIDVHRKVYVFNQTFYSDMSGDNSECPAKDSGSPDKMSGDAQINLAYSEIDIISEIQNA